MEHVQFFDLKSLEIETLPTPRKKHYKNFTLMVRQPNSFDVSPADSMNEKSQRNFQKLFSITEGERLKITEREINK